MLGVRLSKVFQESKFMKEITKVTPTESNEKLSIFYLEKKRKRNL